MRIQKTKRSETAAVEAVAAVTLDGEKYELAFDFNEIVNAERESGANLMMGLTNIANLSALQLTGLFVAGIRAANPPVFRDGQQTTGSRITFLAASKLIRYDTILPIVEALAQSLLLSRPPKTA